MRVLFAGSPEAAVPTLAALAESRHELVAVLTRPPAPSGRGRHLRPSAVGQWAGARGLPMIEARGVRDPAVRARIAGARADLAVVVAYGAIVPPDLLALPPHGWINLHFSDLPRWRGAAPVQYAILHGDARTASCVFQLEEGLDTGPVYSRVPVDVGRATAGELLARLARIGARQVVDTVDAIEAGTARAVAQDEGTAGERVALSHKITREDAHVDFAEPAQSVDRRIRACTPDPGAWTTVRGGGRLRLWPAVPVDGPGGPAGTIVATKRAVRVCCARGAVELGDVAPAGRGRMPAAAWWRGARLGQGATLGGAVA